MGRRGENIRKRADGRWEARVITAHDASGKARYRYLYGKTYQEVREKKMKLLAEKENNLICTETNRLKTSFSTIAMQWLASRKDTIKESTYACYYMLLQKHLIPALGEYPLTALNREVLDAYLRSLLKNGRSDGKGGLSPKTVSDIRSLLLLILKYARLQHYPCPADHSLFSPKNHTPAIHILSPEEQLRLERFLLEEQTPFHLGLMLTLYSGLRIGEICALQWSDLLLEDRLLSVAKTLIRIPEVELSAEKRTRVLIDRPKTDSSIRLVPIPDFLAKLLSGQRREDDVYLRTGTEHYMEPRICLDKYKQVLHKALLPPYTFHTLRHTFATRCVESGFDPKSLSEILGHSNVTTTLQRYVHPTMELKRRQMEKLAQFSICSQNCGQKIT